MELYDKLSGNHSFDNFIDFDNSAPTLDDLDVKQMNWEKGKEFCKECIDVVMSPNKAGDLHYLVKENNSEFTTAANVTMWTTEAFNFLDYLQLWVKNRGNRKLQEAIEAKSTGVV